MTWTDEMIDGMLAGLAPESHSTMTAAERAAVLAEGEKSLAGIGVTDADKPLTVTGVALSWTSVASGISGRGPTRFEPSAFGSAPFFVPVLNQHATDQPLGVAQLIPTEEGLLARAQIADTQAGRDALALIRSGGLSGFSIGFDVVTSRQEGSVRVVTNGKISEVSITTFPADGKARIQTAGGQPTPRFLHAADPVERETHDVPSASAVMQIVSAAERDLARILGTVMPGDTITAASATGRDWLGRALPATAMQRWEREQSRLHEQWNREAVANGTRSTRARATARGEGDDMLSGPRKPTNSFYVPETRPASTGLPGPRPAPAPADPRPGYDSPGDPRPGYTPGTKR